MPPVNLVAHRVLQPGTPTKGALRRTLPHHVYDKLFHNTPEPRGTRDKLKSALPAHQYDKLFTGQPPRPQQPPPPQQQQQLSRQGSQRSLDWDNDSGASAGVGIPPAGGNGAHDRGKDDRADRMRGRAPHHESAQDSTGTASTVSLVGKTIAAAGLRNLAGVFLVKIERAAPSPNHNPAPVRIAPGPDTTLRLGDKLFFAGKLEAMRDITRLVGPSLTFDNGAVDLNKEANEVLVEAVVATRSHLVGHTLKESNFREKYGAAVIAVHRQGERIVDKLGSIQFEGGDSLLLLTGTQFMKLHNADDSFANLTEHKGARGGGGEFSWKAVLTGVLTLCMIIASIAGVDLLTAALVAIVLLVLTGCLETKKIYPALNLPVLIVIAAAFGVSQAMQNSGAAAMIADGLVKASEPSGTLGLQIVIYVATVLFSACVTNNAAVTIMFPIAYQAAQDVQQDFRIYMYLLMMGASASFMTPTGYQTNLMVYGPGGYKFMDFVKFGGLLQIYLGVITITILQTLNLWWLWTLVGFAGLIGVLSIDVLCCTTPSQHAKRSQSGPSPGGGEDDCRDEACASDGAASPSRRKAQPYLRKRLNSMSRVDTQPLSDIQRGLLTDETILNYEDDFEDAASSPARPEQRRMHAAGRVGHSSADVIDPRSTLQV